MHYDETVPEWDMDDIPQRAGLDARLQSFLLEHLDNDPMYQTTVTGLAEDLVSADQVRMALHHIAIAVGNMAIGAYGGRTEAIAAFRVNLERLERIAREGYC